MFRIFFILFRSWVINKNVKNECVETRSFLIFGNNSRSKQNYKNPAHPFVDIGKSKTCTKFRQKILNCREFGACQSFQIFRQNTLFLKNNRALSKFLYGYQIITKSVHEKTVLYQPCTPP